MLHFDIVAAARRLLHHLHTERRQATLHQGRRAIAGTGGGPGGDLGGEVIAQRQFAVGGVAEVRVVLGAYRDAGLEFLGDLAFDVDIGAPYVAVQ
ncbi:hypothetical protein D3C76_1376150 [compost metagenome]